MARRPGRRRKVDAKRRKTTRAERRPAVDYGTAELRRHRATAMGVTYNPDIAWDRNQAPPAASGLSPMAGYVLGTLYDNGYIAALEHDAGLEYAIARMRVYGPPTVQIRTLGYVSEPNEDDADRARNRMHLLERIAQYEDPSPFLVELSSLSEIYAKERLGLALSALKSVSALARSEVANAAIFDRWPPWLPRIRAGNAWPGDNHRHSALRGGLSALAVGFGLMRSVP